MADFFKQKGLDFVYEELGKVPKGKLKKQLEQKHGTTYKQLLDLYYGKVSSCPECGESMSPVGFDFRVPAKSDKEQWVVIEFLVAHGFAFFGCGCGVGYAPPGKPSDLPQWLKAHTKETEGQKLLRRFLEQT